MQTTTKIILAVCSIVTVETLAPANAQYYPPPGYGHATVIGHGMDVPRGGRFRAETAHPTKVRAVVAGTPGMDARPVTRYRVETAHPIDLEGEAGRQVTHEKMRREGIAVHIANLPELVGKPSDVGSTISNRQAEQMTQPSPRMLSVLRDRG